MQQIYCKTNGKDSSWYWLLTLWIIVTAYNLLKPYHIDDTAHLEIARWIASNPWHPMRGTLNWIGFDEPIYKTNQPHLYFYILALWTTIFGFTEIATHALQSLFSLACIVLFFRLARFCVGPLAIWLTALLILGPAFVVEQNLMVDVPLLAIWLCFFNLIICGLQSPHQTKRYFLAALACSAACLVKYSSLVLCVILCLSLLFERRWRQLWTMLVPLAALGAWSLFNYLDYGGIHIATRQSKDWLSALDPWILRGWAATLGGITPIGIIAFGERLLKRPCHQLILYISAACVLLGLCLLVAFGLMPDTTCDQVLHVLFIVNCLAAMIAMIEIGLSQFGPRLWNTDEFLNYISTDYIRVCLYLWLWIVGALCFYIPLAPFVAARHILLILPPILLLLGYQWRESLSVSSRQFGIWATLAVSLGLCLSDWRFASFYKEQAASLAASLPAGSRTWVTGQWGWQWYAAVHGMQKIDRNLPALRTGDYLAMAIYNDETTPPANFNLTLVRTIHSTHNLLSLICTARTVRFYATILTPWSITRECSHRIDLYEVGNSR